MKVRTGFVSNSSSSSFILHIRKLPPCPHCGRKDVDLLSLLKDADCEESGIRSRSKKEILARYKDEFEDEDNDDSSYNRLKKKFTEIKEPGTIIEVSIQYGEETLIDLIKGLPSVTILEELG